MTTTHTLSARLPLFLCYAQALAPLVARSVCHSLSLSPLIHTHTDQYRNRVICLITVCSRYTCPCLRAYSTVCLVSIASTLSTAVVSAWWLRATSHSMTTKGTAGCCSMHTQRIPTLFRHSTSRLSSNKSRTKGAMFIGVWADTTECAEVRRDRADTTLPEPTKRLAVVATSVKPISSRKIREDCWC